jgi:hypothetical protein
MNKQCKFTNAKGYRCGSYAFNLYKENIEQGNYCDRHYWQERAMEAAAQEREACAKVCDLAMLQNQEAINELEDNEHIAKCFIQGAMTQLVKTSKAIRARGTT